MIGKPQVSNSVGLEAHYSSSIVLHMIFKLPFSNKAEGKLTGAVDSRKALTSHHA